MFSRIAIESGPCGYGPDGQTWGPMNAKKAERTTKLLMDSLNCTTIEDLRRIKDATLIRWPDVIMNTDPYFSGYFEDHWLVPPVFREGKEGEESAVLRRWQSGLLVNSLDGIIMGFNSKDGTSAFYGTAPLLGNVPPDLPETSEEDYLKRMNVAWSDRAKSVIARYNPIDYNSSIQSAFIQADADAYVICPTLQLARDAALVAKRNVYVYEFSHFHPNHDDPRGFGCDNGVELDVISPTDPVSTSWATHGAETQFVFGTESGSDGLGPPNNFTTCKFSESERELSSKMMYYWASLARSGNPNGGDNDGGSMKWEPFYSSTLHGDGSVGSALLLRIDYLKNVIGIHSDECEFWDNLL